MRAPSRIGSNPAQQNNATYTVSYWAWHQLAFSPSGTVYDVCAAQLRDLDGYAYRNPAFNWSFGVPGYWQNDPDDWSGLVDTPEPSAPVLIGTAFVPAVSDADWPEEEERLSTQAFGWLTGPLVLALTARGGPRPQTPGQEKPETRAVRAIIANGAVAPGYTAKPGRRLSVREGAVASSGGSSATRDIDGLRLDVAIRVGTTAEPARRMADGLTWTQMGRMHAGALSGRDIGEQVWNSAWGRAGKVQNDLRVVVLDGRTAIMVFVELPILERRDGVPFRRKLDPNDIRMAEDIAIGCVKRARAAGFGADPARPARKLGPKPETLPGSRPPDEPAARKKRT